MSINCILIAIMQRTVSHDTHSLLPSWLVTIIALFSISFKVITHAAIILTPIINSFLAKLYIFATVIQYFFRAIVNYNKCYFIS